MGGRSIRGGKGGLISGERGRNYDGAMGIYLNRAGTGDYPRGILKKDGVGPFGHICST